MMKLPAADAAADAVAVRWVRGASEGTRDNQGGEALLGAATQSMYANLLDNCTVKLMAIKF